MSTGTDRYQSPLSERYAELGIEPKDPMIVKEHQGEIRIKPYTLRCNFCGTTEDVHEFHGKGICEACATKAFEKLGGGQ